MLLALVAASHAFASPFVNLDFEQSTVQPNDPFFVPTSAAFPGWTAQIGGVTQTSVYHDAQGAGDPVVALYDHDIGSSYRLLQGQYMAYLTPGTSDTRTSLSQVGDIPAGTRSMTLLCDFDAGPPIVRLNGSLIQMQFVSSDPFDFIATYGADVSTFGGQAVELKLECGPRQELYSGRRSVDDIGFSRNSLPEPSAILLGTILCLMACRDRSHFRIRREDKLVIKESNHAGNSIGN